MSKCVTWHQLNPHWGLTNQSPADEVLHLTATMQFCRFHSVIGTMWAMADADGPALAGDFYKLVFSGRRQGAPYYERMAEAPRDAVMKRCSAQSFVRTGIRVALFVHVAVHVQCCSCAVLFVHTAIHMCFCSCTMLSVHTTVRMRCCPCVSYLPWPRALMASVRVQTQSKRSTML